MAEKEQMLRVPRVATMLDVCKKRVYQLIHEGKLEAVRLGPRQTRILKDSYNEYIERLRRQERIARGDELPEQEAGAACHKPPTPGSPSMRGESGRQSAVGARRAIATPKPKARAISRRRCADLRGGYASQLKTFFGE